MKETNKAIRIWFIEQGISQAAIAREAGVSRSLVCMVLQGKRRNAAVLEALKKHSFPLGQLGCESEAA